LHVSSGTGVVQEYNYKRIVVVQCYKSGTVVKVYRSTTGIQLIYRYTRVVEE